MLAPAPPPAVAAVAAAEAVEAVEAAAAAAELVVHQVLPLPPTLDGSCQPRHSVLVVS